MKNPPEHDYVLTYNGPIPFAVGAQVPSGTTDDNGHQIVFPGVGYVVAAEHTQGRDHAEQSRVWVKTYRQIM